MDWTGLFLVIFSLLVVILAIANSIYFWRIYSTPPQDFSTGYALTLLISNILLAIIALVVLVWGIYTMIKTAPTSTIEETSIIVPPLQPTKAVIPKPLCSPRPTVNKVPSAEILLS